MATIKYAIADDHEVFRKGLKLILSDDETLNFVFEASNGKELIEKLETNEIGVVLLDLKMPVMDGFETAKVLKRKYPDIKILILSMFEEEQFILHMMESGANGYLLKNASPEEITKALHIVTENNYYFNDLVSAVMLKKIMDKDYVQPKFKSSVNLNERDIQVLRLICEGRTAQEIGEEVYLSPRTVEGIRAGMMEKIGVKNIAGLVMYAAKNGIA